MALTQTRFDWLFPTSLCGVLVFRLDPAGAPLLRPLLLLRRLLLTHTHHSTHSTHSLPPCLPPSLTHSLPHSLPHSLTPLPHSLTPSLTPLTHSTHSLHSLTHSIHSLHSLTPLTHSLHSLHSLTHSLHSTPLHSSPLHSTPLHSTPLHSTPLHATPRHATPRHATPRHATPRHATPRHALTHSLTHRRLPSRGRRSTQSLLEELRRAWAPLGRGWLRVARAVQRASWLPFAWQAQYTEPPGGAAARMGAAGPRLASRGTRSTESFLAAFRVAGAVHRASWRSCGARGRRWAAAGFE